MADIAIVRVDSRLIHGQVLSRWVVNLGANRIIIIDDDLANDPFLVSIFKMATPPGTSLDVFTISEGTEGFKQNAFGEGRAIVLFKNLHQARYAYEDGFAYEELQVAGLGAGPGKKPVFRTVSVSQTGAKTLQELMDKGVDVYFQSVPEEERTEVGSVLQENFPELY